MAQKILTLRLKTQDERNINDLLKMGRYKSKTEIIREALLLLREKEAETTLKHVSRRVRKHPKLDINTVSKRIANSWITSEESGDLIDADRER